MWREEGVYIDIGRLDGLVGVAGEFSNGFRIFF